MGGSKAKRGKQSRRQLEPLISTRRDDGLWQSIERDEEDLSWHEKGEAQPMAVAKDEDASNEGLIQRGHERHRDSATTAGKENAPQAPSDLYLRAVNKESPTEHHSSTSSRADILAWVSVSPPQHEYQPRDHSPPLRPAPAIAHNEPPTQDEPRAATRRRRGRPKKSRNAPNWNRPRRVRFSDPIPPADPVPLPLAEPRDTHVFVRLLKIIVTADNAHRQELVWNNRAKGWRLAGERSERNIRDIGDLFDDIPTNGSLLKVVLAPTVQRGAREPVEAVWDVSRGCFQGLSQDGGSLTVALGEVKDMVKDPWARQFIGYALI